ncbi:hypothetical protein F0357_16695 [Rhizobiales bacterium Sp-1]|uniref:Uncharacterized protein n=1 Tax=Segnochrobactrum spirostomi TaxID=2608987 RepID=A0A6A7Y506_9HYPH|nr:hypothetical protein [Segnochrobactrum spirostomi]
MLRGWIIEALVALGGSGTVVDVARHIWENHETELRASGDLFYKWQYEMRWVGRSLVEDKIIIKQSRPRLWILR